VTAGAASSSSLGLDDAALTRLLSRRPSLRSRIIRSPWPYRAAVFVLFGVIWQIYSTTAGKSMLFPTFIGAMGGVAQLLVTPRTYEAFLTSNVSLMVGFPIAVLLGVLAGLGTARFRQVESFVDPYIGILLVTPMAAFIPIVVMALGLGLASRTLLILVFAIPVIIVNSRAGVRGVDPQLVEMSFSFGATERQIWRNVLLPGALPVIMSGIRLGLGRGVTGMVVIELLLVSVGIGGLFLNFRGRFETDLLYGLVVLVVMEALVLVSVARFVERRIAPWAQDVAIID